MERRKITESEILAAATPKGGWKRETLAAWGVPWPPPSGWKAALLADGAPYDERVLTGSAEVTLDGLARMEAKSVPEIISGAPFGVEGDLDIDPAKLLRKVVSAVVSAGHASDLYEFPDVLAFFGSRNPPVEPD